MEEVFRGNLEVNIRRGADRTADWNMASEPRKREVQFAREESGTKER